MPRVEPRALSLTLLGAPVPYFLDHQLIHLVHRHVTIAMPELIRLLPQHHTPGSAIAPVGEGKSALR